ncbi:MAG: DUF2281 domain-containing protein [Methylococcales bacterium]|nr:DUF2281 domain-containing protein [Methylococcales bacterium]
MYAAIEGVYENGRVILKEAAPTTKTSKVLIMFIEEEINKTAPIKQTNKGVKIGSLVGKGYSIPDDFDEPLEDLKEYM